MFTAFVPLACCFLTLADSHNVFELLVPSLNMGMMKKHVKGPIKCCETIALDMLHKTRAEELVHHPAFHSVDVQVNQRHHHDTHDGRLPSRVVGGPIQKSSPMFLTGC
jgi:hypothetical protein